MMKIPKVKSQIPITDIVLLSRLEFGIFFSPQQNWNLEFLKLEFNFLCLKQKNHH
jgi:hypothetical protein